MSNRNTDNNWIIGNYETNRYRDVIDLDLDEDYYYYEVEIYGDGEYHIGKIDIDFLERFTERTWVAYKSGNNFYMRSGATIKFPDRPYFHRLVLHEVEKVDHRNGNGLDNRKKNLRDGSGGVNENNQTLHNDNTSGINGVSFISLNKRWRVQWYENGVLRAKYFSIKKYGSDEKAKQEAIKHRQAMNEITGCLNGTRKSSLVL